MNHTTQQLAAVYNALLETNVVSKRSIAETDLVAFEAVLNSIKTRTLDPNIVKSLRDLNKNDHKGFRLFTVCTSEHFLYMCMDATTISHALKVNQMVDIFEQDGVFSVKPSASLYDLRKTPRPERGNKTPRGSGFAHANPRNHARKDAARGRGTTHSTRMQPEITDQDCSDMMKNMCDIEPEKKNWADECDE